MNCLRVPQILLPEQSVDLSKWAVIACDQFTSQREYWEETRKIVGDCPSTLHLILPEVYLGGEEEESRIEKIHQTMKEYKEKKILQSIEKGFVLVQRGIGTDCARNGLVVEVDLEAYEYKKGSTSLIRPTEKTVEERIPPRLKVRQRATLELPHIMLLIDDPEKKILEPLIEKRERFKKIYDTKLMQGGGDVAGWLIPEGEETEQIMRQIEELADEEVFREKYQLEKSYPLLNMAVGDGNHSMATAKASWEKIKEGLSDEEKETHPARYCLCEIVNVHDASLEIEPIHRVLFGVEKEDVMERATHYYKELGCGVVWNRLTKNEMPVATKEAHGFTICTSEGFWSMKIENPKGGIAAATIQSFLDFYVQSVENAKIDYIHGTETVEILGREPGNMGILLPEVKKADLFTGVIKDGVLPRKTFSMGEANEKRYYMECKEIG